MEWKEAIIRVLEEEGKPMHYKDILEKIDNKGYKIDYNGRTTENSVNSILSRNKSLFECVERGVYKLVDTSVTAAHPSSTAGLTPGWAASVVVSPSTAYASDDSNYKKASDFITSEVPSDDEKKLLELIVNFRLNDKVCFADILGNLNVEFSDKTDNDAIRHQSIDRTLLENKLKNLNKQIEKIRNNPQLRNKYDIERMMSAAGKAEQLLDDYEDNVEFGVSRLGEFVHGDKPKVVIYYKNIENNIGTNESRRQVMAGVFVHEMFHAWNYFKAGLKSWWAIDEPMVEFGTLYFLKELETFTKSLSHPLHENVSSVRVNRESRVQDKQQSIGDVAAYGFGYYLFKELIKMDGESIKWIETYSEKSASIKKVKKVEDALKPIYPFMLEAEVMQWFKKIIFDRYTTPVTVGKSASAKTGLDVSLRDLVLACIKTIGRKYFEAKELYAFAPIFKLCAAVSGNLEDTLKQQLDELVKDGVLEVLSDGCYSRKLAGVEDKPISKVKTPAKSKGGYTRGSSIPFAVKFPDGVIFADNKAVKTFIKSLQKIGLSNVQHVGIMIQGYNLVSDVERPSDGKNKWQDYVDDKYIYTKLANSLKIKYLNQIAKKLGISIEINDIC